MTKKVLVPKKRGRPVKVATLANPTLSAMTCVDLMTQALMSRREAIRTEISVALGIFFEAGRTSKDAKDILCQVYARVGYDCLVPEGPDYKTINRRINNAAMLFDKLGYDKLKAWVGKSTEYALVSVIREQVLELGLNSMDDLLVFCGKPSRRAQLGLVVNGEDGFVSDERGAGGSAIRIDTPKIHWVVPKESTPQDLMEFASKIMQIAKELEQKQAYKPMQNDAIAEAVRQAQLVHGEDEPVGETQVDRGIVPENFPRIH